MSPKLFTAVTIALFTLFTYGMFSASNGFLLVGLAALVVEGFFVAIRTDDVTRPISEQLMQDKAGGSDVSDVEARQPALA